MEMQALVDRAKRQREADGLAFRYLSRIDGEWKTHHSPTAADRDARMAAYAGRGIAVESI